MTNLQRLVVIYGFLALQGVAAIILAFGIAQVPGTFGIGWEDAGRVSRQVLFVGVGAFLMGTLVPVCAVMFLNRPQEG